MMGYKKTYDIKAIAISELIEIFLCLPFLGCPARTMAVHRTDPLGNPPSTFNINFSRNGATAITASLLNGKIVRAKQAKTTNFRFKKIKRAERKGEIH